MTKTSYVEGKLLRAYRLCVFASKYFMFAPREAVLVGLFIAWDHFAATQLIAATSIDRCV